VRVVVDTNVLMSGILFSGPPGRILDAWRDDRLRLVMSPEIVDEYVRVAERLSKQYRAVDVEPILALVVQKAEVVPSVPLPQPVCDDPGDDKFLACALAATAAVVVSGDRKLRAVSGYEGVTVLTPRQFIDEWL
jgi:hypothetical protein